MKAQYHGPQGIQNLTVVSRSDSPHFKFGVVTLADDKGVVVTDCPVSEHPEVLADAMGKSVKLAPSEKPLPDVGFAVLLAEKAVKPEPPKTTVQGNAPTTPPPATTTRNARKTTRGGK